ncbi:PrgI family protein [bacterium 1xD8-6]|nr:PrgI family protein [bacterium D16-36]RKI63043.1 PrgI family protein [bacterium 1xD8-6]
MVIDINKNIDNYKETVVLGLTAKQLIYSVLSVAVGGGIVLLLYQKVGLTVSAYIAIPAVTPIALSGFYSYNGMGFIEMMKLKMHFACGNRALAYVSTEGEDVIQNIREQEMLADKKERKKQKGRRKKADSREDFQKTAKKMLLSVFLLLIMLGALAGAAVWYKYFR